jgi:Subtilase family
MPPPQTAARRAERPRPIPLPVETLMRRAEIAARLRDQINPLSASLRTMNDAERKAVFFKLEHEGPVSLTGTGLKAVAEPSDRFTLAVPTANDLSAFTEKLDQFEGAAPRNGVVPNSRLATAMESIRVGEPTDRLSQELLENYDRLIQQPQLICEVELLSLQSGKTQQRDELQKFRHLLRTELDRDRGIGALFEHEEIKGTCRAVIRCTGNLFRRLVEEREWQRRIYWFEARPEFETFHRVVEDFNVAGLGPITSPPPDATVVCIIDSGVTAGNPFLKPVVQEELLKSFLRNAPNDASDEYGHGSGVASLAAYHSLNPTAGAENAGKVWIASARILTAENRLEDERLFSSLLREVVEHFAPRGVKIFNLSVNIRNLSWNKNAKRTQPRRSWVARTIDELARKHDVVFIASTGNLLPIDVRDFYNDGKPYPEYFADEEACILDPGQAALAVSVGSAAPTTLAEGQVARARAIALRDFASPFTRCGPGIRREIKPDLTDYGGNYLIDEEGGQVRANRALGVAVATHQLTPALRYDSGTSLAAPRTTHKLALVLSDLRSMGVEPSADLLKAFLVNSARYRIGGDDLEAFKAAVGANQWLNVLGYGMADDVRATYCDPHEVTLFYQGTITPNTIAFLDIPVPTSLREAGREIKRLTVTVTYSPEVQRWGLERYLGTALKWRVFRGDVPREDVVTAMSLPDEDEVPPMQAVPVDGVEEPGVPNELGFELGITKRSRGAIQHDVAEWNLHKPEFSAHNYTLAIAAYEKWGRGSPPAAPFAVVVRLEETSRTAEIYEEVRNALIALQVRARA